MKLSAIILALFSALLLGGAPKLAPFRDGERVAFFGDSITQIGLYVNYLHAWQILRHPETRVEFINCGVNGNNVSLALARYERDLMMEKPTKVFLMFGMNDAGQSLYPAAAVVPTAQQLKSDKMSGNCRVCPVSRVVRRYACTRGLTRKTRQRGCAAN